MYMNNDTSVLSMLLGASTFSEFLVAAETQARISRHDTELVEKLEMEAQIIEKEQENNTAPLRAYNKRRGKVK